jgi:hypothetical protein
MATQHRRSTDQLDLTNAQRGFLDQMVGSVSEAVVDAVRDHEEGSHLDSETITEVVKMTIADGDYVFPNGQSPQELLSHHRELAAGQKKLEARHDNLDRNVDRILDVVVGPVAEDWKGDPDPDGMRDESQGLMAQTAIAMRVAEKMDEHLSNGGVPVQLPTNIKVAIWGAAATIGASAITASALVTASVLG